MKNANNKKTAAGWIAATLAFAVLIAGFGTGVFYLDRENRASRLEVENFYQQNIYQMNESVTGIEVNMSKLMISGEDAETAVLLNDTYHHSQTAFKALSNLPVNAQDKAATGRFLNQLGDWCLVQSKKILNKGVVDDDDIILVGAAAMPDENEEASGEKKSKALNSFEDQSEELYIRAKRLAIATRDAASRFKDGYKVINNLSEGLMTKFDINDTNAENITDTPEIIYDGPFSDGQTTKHFKGLEDKKEISVAAAIKKAEKIFEDLGLRELSSIGETSSPAAYVLYGKANSGEMYVNMSKKGGIVLSAGVPCDNTGKKNRYGEEKCKEFALKYAEMCGYEKLSPVWYAEADGFATVNLTPVKDNTVVYPDLVKVKVCKVTGDFKGIEAMGYCTCHCERDLEPYISVEEAQKAVSPRLTITGRRLAIIPKDMKEVLCYEFAAEYKGLDYFVYVDASTGRQADIMRVIDDGQGKLVR